MGVEFKLDDIIQHVGTGHTYLIVGTPDENKLEATGEMAYGYKAPMELTSWWRARVAVEDGRYSKIGEAHCSEPAGGGLFEATIGFKRGDVVRHKRSDGLYKITHVPLYNRLADSNKPVYGYRSLTGTGPRWWREQAEMEDGRFELFQVG